MPLLVLVVALAVLVAVGAGQAARAVIDRGRAQAAADAAALAGVHGGRAAAVRLASANGATLVSYAEVAGGRGSVFPAAASTMTVTVVVLVGDVRASARATNGP